MSGSFLKSSLLNGTGTDFSFVAAEADLGALVAAVAALAPGGGEEGTVTGAVAGARPTGASAFTNLICELA